MSQQRESLVAIMNNPLDLAIAREQHWYRIPLRSVTRFLHDDWPPKWIAFYQTKAFDEQAYAVHYLARVLDIRKVFRWELFPDQPRGPKGRRRYYQLVLSTLEPLPTPIPSRRLRRIVFIPTTWEKLTQAAEINDLYDESPLEDRLWGGLKQLQILAERQEFVEFKRKLYALDFAIYCAQGNLDVETDGDYWHANPEASARDSLRDNDLVTAGWDVLRFTSHQINERLESYCVPKVIENITRLGGLADPPRLLTMPDEDMLEDWQQLTLFDLKAIARAKSHKKALKSKRQRHDEPGESQLSLFGDKIE